MYVIYLDILFVINWTMDLLIFLTVTMILNKWLSLKRHIVAALIASILYCMLVILPWLQMIPYSLYSLWIPVIPILFLYRPSKLRSFMKYYLICMGIAGLYGGVIFNVWSIIGGKFQKIHTMQLSMLLGISIGIAAIFYKSFYWIRHQTICHHFTYQLILERGGKKVQLLGLMDTGNLLYTPVTHQPVIVAPLQVVKSLLSEEEYEGIKAYMALAQEEDIEAYLINETLRPDCFIPFNSIGCHVGYLWGLRVDGMTVKIGKGEKVVANCIVGISKDPLYADKLIQVLLHPDFILEGEKTYEMAI